MNNSAVDPNKYRFNVSNVFKPLSPTLNKGFRSYGVCLLEVVAFLALGIYCGGYLVNKNYHIGMYSIVISVLFLSGVWIHFLGLHFNSRRLLLVHCYSCMAIAMFQIMVLMTGILIDVFYEVLLLQPSARKVLLTLSMEMLCSSALAVLFGISSYIRAREIRTFQMARDSFIFFLRGFDAYLTSSFGHKFPKYTVQYKK
ncbi:unnamed protein product [Bursaphelenchus xylophilus]|uniref:(pine wood nematode) hypothetical protein n=1 Tax=Bursaphelenchus xylophilus TaxID=6326 RepID=A0A1I7SVP5_BURXY|nr:unnamed protein product [Bursaphelenchus xylophilus]CAG9098037.1 unnamed protein product [Bursaphelenchus xylophilus]